MRILMLTVLVPLIQDAKEIDVRRHPWACWKPGSSVTVRNVWEGAHAQESVATMTFVELKGNKVQLSRVIKNAQGESKIPRTLTLYRFKAIGKEKLKIDGKVYDCTVFRAERRFGKGTIMLTEWFTRDGKLPLKFIENISGDTIVTESVMTAVKIGVRMTVAGREFDCIKYEGTSLDEIGGIESIRQDTLWLSAGIPGYTVKNVVVTTQSGRKTRRTTTAANFKIAK